MRSNWVFGLTICCFGVGMLICSFSSIHYKHRAWDAEYLAQRYANEMAIVARERDAWKKKYEAIEVQEENK